MLNEQQLRAVNSKSNKIVCIAGAGSGKTFTTLARIDRLISEGVDPVEVLALTFTNAAASEMKMRFHESHMDSITPNFCTFHSFCYSLLASNRKILNAIGYFGTVPSIADPSELKKIHTCVVQQCGIRLSEAKLNGKSEITRSERFQYELYWKQFKKLLSQKNLITFDIMCYDVCKLFVSNSPVVAGYKTKYKYIFVDEFQDTDARQWEFVKSFSESNLFVCGDAKQNLYRFKGTTNEIIKSLTNNPEWETIKLFENYRSTTQICEYANKLHISWGDSPYNLMIHGQNSGVEVVEADTFRLGTKCAIDDMMSILSDIRGFETSAILCRTNSEVAGVCELLKRCKVSYRTKSGRRPIVHVLKSVLDSAYFVNWLSDQLPSKYYNEYIKLVSVDEEYGGEDKFLRVFGKDVSRYATPVLKIRELMRNEEFVFSKVRVVSEYLGLPNREMTIDGNEDESVIKYLIDVAESINSDSNLYVGTIHSVKGLEYDSVHLIGVNGRSFPINHEDQINVFYVGCTRARKKLTIWFG